MTENKAWEEKVSKVISDLTKKNEEKDESIKELVSEVQGVYKIKYAVELKNKELEKEISELKKTINELEIRLENNHER